MVVAVGVERAAAVHLTNGEALSEESGLQVVQVWFRLWPQLSGHLRGLTEVCLVFVLCEGEGVCVCVCVWCVFYVRVRGGVSLKIWSRVCSTG